MHNQNPYFGFWILDFEGKPKFQNFEKRGLIIKIGLAKSAPNPFSILQDFPALPTGLRARSQKTQITNMMPQGNKHVGLIEFRCSSPAYQDPLSVMTHDCYAAPLTLALGHKSSSSVKMPFSRAPSSLLSSQSTNNAGSSSCLRAVVARYRSKMLCPGAMGTERSS